MKIIINELNKKVIKLSQPMSDYYVFSIKAKELLQICEVSRLEDGTEEEIYGQLSIPFSKIKSGTQRKMNSQQVLQIKDYITSGDAAFPNTIILGANLDDKGFLIKGDDKRRWEVNNNELKIPKTSFMASIIDGQHRVLGFQRLFDESPNNEFLNMDILCAVYLDLPLTYHAQIFTHINATPRRVDRNLIYQLYQIDMDEKTPESWSPEVLSVYLAKAIDTDENSPLRDRLKLSVKERPLQDGWRYTFAAVVEGLLMLISSNPKRDKNILARATRIKSKDKGEIVFANRSILSEQPDSAPLRKLYLEQKDSTIYSFILRYVKIIHKNLLSGEENVFQKSIGFTACFQALKDILELSGKSKDSVLDSIENNIHRINLDKLPETPSTRVQGILKNLIILIVKDELGIKSKDINIKATDVDIYRDLIG